MLSHGRMCCLSGSIQAKSSYEAIEFSFVFDYNANEAYFDGGQLFPERFDYSYGYDALGRIETVTDLEGRVTKYTYRGDTSDILTVTYPGENWQRDREPDPETDPTASFTYSATGLLTGTVSTDGVATSHSYDPFYDDPRDNEMIKLGYELYWR